jgi:glycosyltransferase involved in cell wall biosynthesis
MCKVSIIIPTYNRQRLLKKTLRSLFNQSFPKDHYEIVIVDDGSTDETEEMVKNLSLISPVKIKYFKQENKGPGSARNKGASNADGDILIFCDSDIIYDPGYLKNLVRPIQAGEAIGTTHAHEYIANIDNPLARCWGTKRIAEDLIERFVYRAISKQAFLEVGGFDPARGYCDDWTLVEKFKTNALIVSEAICYHHNPDTLKDVFNQAKWIGETYFLSEPRTLPLDFYYKLLYVSVPLWIIGGLYYPILLLLTLVILFAGAINRIYPDRRVSYLWFYPLFMSVYSWGFFYGIEKYYLKNLKGAL